MMASGEAYPFGAEGPASILVRHWNGSPQRGWATPKNEMQISARPEHLSDPPEH
jgi:hypothetical protein